MYDVLKDLLSTENFVALVRCIGIPVCLDSNLNYMKHLLFQLCV